MSFVPPAGENATAPQYPATQYPSAQQPPPPSAAALIPRSAINLPPYATPAPPQQAAAPAQYAAQQQPQYPPQPPTPLFPDGTQGAEFRPNVAIARKNGRNVIFTLLYIFGPLIALMIIIYTVIAPQLTALIK